MAPAEQGSVTLAIWDEKHTPATTFRNALIYRNGAMVLRTRDHDGSTSVQEVAERPTNSPNETRFDLEPDSDRPEYITLADSGARKYLDWAGQQFILASTTDIDADFLTVGVNPVSADCLPKERSPARDRCGAPRIPVELPGLGGGVLRRAARGVRTGAGAREPQPQGGGLSARGPVRAAAGAHGAVGRVARAGVCTASCLGPAKVPYCRIGSAEITKSSK